MFVTRKDHWFHLLFAWRGTVLIKIWRRYLFVVSLATLITVLFHFDIVIHFGLSDKPFSLIGLALGIFLGFRNNTSYDRFWEGRKLWGGVVNTSRSICRKIDTMIFDVDDDQKHELIRLVACYPHLLAQHLRKESDFSVIQHLCKDTSFLEKEKNVPAAFLHMLGLRFRKLYEDQKVHPFHYPCLEEELQTFTNLQGGCERIKATPIPFSYNVLMHRIVGIYCLTLPFGLIETINDFTPLAVAVVAYAFLGLDAIGEEIEDPFGRDPNDLPLNYISTMIEMNLMQRIDHELPQLPEPHPRTHILS